MFFLTLSQTDLGNSYIDSCKIATVPESGGRENDTFLCLFSKFFSDFHLFQAEWKNKYCRGSRNLVKIYKINLFTDFNQRTRHLWKHASSWKVTARRSLRIPGEKIGHLEKRRKRRISLTLFKQFSSYFRQNNRTALYLLIYYSIVKRLPIIFLVWSYSY